MSQKPAFSFSHVGLYVTDLDKMTDFYENFLGFTVTDRGDLGAAKIVFLSRDPDEHHQIALITGRPADLAYNVINQISFRLAHFSDLNYFYANMKNLPAGMVSDIDPVTHGNALSIYFRDPEGNRLELFVNTPWYASQPMKVPFNPEDTEESIWAWLEETVKQMPGYKSREAWKEEVAKAMNANKQ